MTFQIWSSMTETAQQDPMPVNKSLSPSVVSSVTKWAAFLRGCFYNLSTGYTQPLLCATGIDAVKSLTGSLTGQNKKRGSCPVHRKGYTNYKLKLKRVSWLLFCQGAFHKEKRRVSKRSWKRSYMKRSQGQSGPGLWMKTPWWLFGRALFRKRLGTVSKLDIVILNNCVPFLQGLHLRHI